MMSNISEHPGNQNGLPGGGGESMIQALAGWMDGDADAEARLLSDSGWMRVTAPIRERWTRRRDTLLAVVDHGVESLLTASEAGLRGIAFGQAVETIQKIGLANQSLSHELHAAILACQEKLSGNETLLAESIEDVQNVQL